MAGTVGLDAQLDEQGTTQPSSFESMDAEMPQVWCSYGHVALTLAATGCHAIY